DDSNTKFAVAVEAQSPSTGATANLSFADRVFTNLGTAALNTPVSSTGHTLDAATTAGLYLFRAGHGLHATITVHPQDSASLATSFVRLDHDEAAAGLVVDTTSAGDDVETSVVPLHGWAAFRVVAVTPPASSQLYDVTVATQAN